MKLNDYLKKQGRGAAQRLAKKISAPQSDLSTWAHEKKPVPPRKAVQIELATLGAVGRKDLLPNDWHEIWPELR